MQNAPTELLRPTQYVERHLLTAILDGTYSPGATLPSERALAEQIGVTRPTLRETLQRLAREGWITIRHGKPTVVNDYWREGGLGLLGTMTKFGEFLPSDLVTQFLEVRSVMLPACAKMTATRAPGAILEYLSHELNLESAAEAFAGYDWGLQLELARRSGNLIYPLILNDFASLYIPLAESYFGLHQARKSSLRFYRELSDAIGKSSSDVERVVRETMMESIVIWKEV
ncbi:MAG: GntR family transcriptional regulator [Deltaproteobacteria bacterium]|nr:GntR family transcriptional regulator [Deltaproteobacteria bacterium]